MIAQTLPPAEIVVVDDGSSDDTASLARSFVGRLPQLKVISIPNGGVSRARNTAIAASSAEIIATLDADDVWHPTYLAKMVAKLRESGEQTAFVYSYFRKIDTKSEIIRRTITYPVDGWGFYQLLDTNYVANGSNAIYWRRLVEAVGGYDTGQVGSEDILLQLLLAWRAPVRIVPEYLVGYRTVETSLSKRWRAMADAGVRMIGVLAEKLPAVRKDQLRLARAARHYSIATTVRREGVGTPTDIVWHSVVALAYGPRRVGLWELRRHAAAPPNPAVRHFPLLGRSFYEVDPAEGAIRGLSQPSKRILRICARHDRAHGVLMTRGLAAGTAPDQTIAVSELSE